MMSRKFSLAAVFVFLASVFGWSQVSFNQLAREAGAPEVNLVEPAASQDTKAKPPSSAELAKEDWLYASQAFGDKKWKAKAAPRLDSDNSPVVMMQGFHWFADNYWYHPPKGWWGVLAEKAPEVAAGGFDLIWFPPAARGSYYPTQWYNLESQWGNKENLLRAVSAMHANGVKVVADIVLNHRNGSTDWADFKNPDWPTTIITKNDEWPGISAQPNYGKSPNYDEGENDSGCRDLDHQNPLVQADAKTYLRWLREVIGYDGWRYDMVKGYAAYYTGMYNAASSPEFSVGEYYDCNKNLVISWMDGTDSAAGKANASSAFDFATRYNVVNAVESGNYGLLNDGGKPSGLIGWWPAKSVTFVENHDTASRDPNFMANASQEHKTQRLMGYAYILTHPGIPCVFWPHYFDWGKDCQNKIKKLVEIRKQAGITSTSSVYICASGNYYAAIITGSKQKVAVKIGAEWGWNPGSGWTLAETGDRYAVWTQPK